MLSKVRPPGQLGERNLGCSKPAPVILALAMVLIEWWLVERLTVGMAIIAVATTSFWLVRKKGSWLPIQILSVLAVTCGLLSIAFVWWAATTSHIYSAPVNSPNGKMSARIDDYSAGGFGGSY